MIFTEKDREFIIKYFPNADELLKSTSVNTVLDAIGDYIDDNGFAPPHYYDYNELGREAQKIYDSIYENNVLN